ncbi:hypothetical protein EYC58_00260 [Candidatus Saccharibacteria bacterium]|nr:MAG: hypothetical protein EYC58_00260 [Candidatus Saccharibacteria bacterium]
MIDPDKYGISFSVKQCRAFGLDPVEALDWLLKQGWRRFRLMSYWDEHEKVQGEFDFAALDKQLEQIAAAGGVVTLCLGARQPRWPENHWPEWAWQADKPHRTISLLHYIQSVMLRYRTNSTIVSYQLENEALLKKFGKRVEVDRKRLRLEYKLVKQLALTKPVIMTTSTSWGIPVRRPRPDIVGFSFYQVLYSAERHRYTTAFHNPWLDRIRAATIRALWRKPSFIHELQLEPWGPQAIWEMSAAEQDKSMNNKQIAINLSKAEQTGLYPIDIWGAEWWYWRHLHGDPAIWATIKKSLTTSTLHSQIRHH